MTQIQTAEYFKANTVKNLGVKLVIVEIDDDEITLDNGTVLTIPYDAGKNIRGLIVNALKQFDRVGLTLHRSQVGRCFII